MSLWASALVAGENEARRIDEVDAQLSLGCLPEAEAEAQDFLCSEAIESDYAPYMLALWLETRVLQGKTLQHDPLSEWLSRMPADEPMLLFFRFLEEQVGGEALMAVESFQDTRWVPIEQGAHCSTHRPICRQFVKVTVNIGSRQIAMVDTGAWTTTLSDQAASEAGAVKGPMLLEITRSGITVRSYLGLVRELEIAGVRVKNLPVIITTDPVLDSMPIVLGIDLMHRVRLTLDYPRKRLVMEPIEGDSREVGLSEAWQLPLALFRAEGLTPGVHREVPLYAFRAGLATVGTLPDGTDVSVLIDTGNYTGSLTADTWARLHAARYDPSGAAQISTSSLVALDPQVYRICGLTLGGMPLPDWPVRVLRSGLIATARKPDLLFGSDMLQRFKVILDVRNRALRLVLSPEKTQRFGTDSRRCMAQLGCADAWWTHGCQLEAEGRLEAALTCFDEVIALDALHEEGWLGKCRTLMRLLRRDEALLSLTHAIELKPSWSLGWVWKAHVLQELGRTSSASEAIAEGVRLGGAEALKQLSELQRPGAQGK